MEKPPAYSPSAMPAEFFFSATYQQARQRFVAAARVRGAALASFGIDAVGAEGEALTTDVALIGPPDGRPASKLLLITSATHGVEGFCGSACQLQLLADDALLARASSAGVALLLVHAINPYGFSWLSRTNEHNIDLNRNAQDFSQPLPVNVAYAGLHDVLLPAAWPPTAENQQAKADYIAQHGAVAYRDAVSKGQYSHAGGVFYGGAARSQSLQNLEQILRTYAAPFADIGWIDVHTGLGPYGHAEKIFAGRRDDAEVARAGRWWGSDMAVPFAGKSTSADVTGNLSSTIYGACPDSRCTLMALEYGTVPFEQMTDALRGEAWLRAHPDAPAELARQIRQAMFNAFCGGDDVWRGMVLGQNRVAMLQAILGLQAAQS
ncbi:M14 family metallopeptidase [Variovorax sp. HJSM1_2]|uniref:M14 family metallopeptidase n=1 Tax=Variovorax sp. HJSM1_2 TaxID=3366263 RepID=UPI003BC65723